MKVARSLILLIGFNDLLLHGLHAHGISPVPDFFVKDPPEGSPAVGTSPCHLTLALVPQRTLPFSRPFISFLSTRSYLDNAVQLD